MDNFLKTQLHPTETCIVCTEPFSATHQPVALPCKHIFGHECIKMWVKNGRGNTTACPTCRYVLIEKRSPHEGFDTASIWKMLCEQPPERLHAFMMSIWCRLQILWQRNPDGKFNVIDILEQLIIPSLIRIGPEMDEPDEQNPDPLRDCYDLVAASWNSLGRPNRAIGLAIPLVRLARLMSCASMVLPRWLTTNARTNRLIWRANACLGITEQDVKWEFIMEASKLGNECYFPLLQLYTVLISQSIAHNPQPNSWPTRRHEIMNQAVEQCCVKIGGGFWRGKPSNEFKEVLVRAYEELRRYQLEKKRISLRGHDGEDRVVKGIWALAGWL